MPRQKSIKLKGTNPNESTRCRGWTPQEIYDENQTAKHQWILCQYHNTTECPKWVNIVQKSKYKKHLEKYHAQTFDGKQYCYYRMHETLEWKLSERV